MRKTVFALALGLVAAICLLIPATTASAATPASMNPHSYCC
ncbi:MAG TPA: hypothetical protein VFW65_08670 [Pseudonocardiaceae bacterium]|nr:hypothetical protein [Pseudonocardiaceae bacterium]